MTIIISALKIIFLLGFLITIHEAGHLIVAKLCKVKVNEFAIGFGPTIWKKQGKETKYAIRLIPLGGFCSMEGEEERSENQGSFSKASIPRRMAIVVAGATVNIIFGLLVYFILMTSSSTYITNEINSVIDGYAAQEIELQQGDKIIKLNGKNIKNKYDLDKVMKKSNGEVLELIIQRNEENLTYNIKPTEVKSKSTGMYLDENAKILSVEKGSSAEKQGIKSNDKIIKVNNQEINNDVNKAIEIIKEKGQNTILLTIERSNEQINIELTPDTISSYYLGVNLKQAEDTFINHLVYGEIETKEFAISILDNIKMIFTGGVSVDQMMGPVGISEAVAKTSGIKEFVYMLALISLSLGVTNLLPIPALDGGKLLILLIEAIRRKPMKEKTEINIQLIGFSILIALSIYITYHDILRIF
ncbi:rIP metalloprotease RseP [Clostridium sp. CAG:575]|nr:rIP metalloprotease RseP [Clostridium sp. CAG:575]